MAPPKAESSAGACRLPRATTTTPTAAVSSISAVATASSEPRRQSVHVSEDGSPQLTRFTPPSRNPSAAMGLGSRIPRTPLWRSQTADDGLSRNASSRSPNDGRSVGGAEANSSSEGARTSRIPNRPLTSGDAVTITTHANRHSVGGLLAARAALAHSPRHFSSGIPVLRRAASYSPRDAPLESRRDSSLSTSGPSGISSMNQSPPFNVNKPLPSAPVAVVVNTASPPKAQRTLVDAEVAGTPTSEEWPVIHPENVPPQAYHPFISPAARMIGASARSVSGPASSLSRPEGHRFSTASSCYSTDEAPPGNVHALTTHDEEAVESPLAGRVGIPPRTSSRLPVVSQSGQDSIPAIGVAITSPFGRGNMITGATRGQSLEPQDVESASGSNSAPIGHGEMCSSMARHTGGLHQSQPHMRHILAEFDKTSSHRRRSMDSDEWSQAAGSSLNEEDRGAFESGTRVTYLSRPSSRSSGVGATLRIASDADAIIYGAAAGAPAMPARPPPPPPGSSLPVARTRARPARSDPSLIRSDSRAVVATRQSPGPGRLPRGRESRELSSTFGRITEQAEVMAAVIQDNSVPDVEDLGVDAGIRSPALAADAKAAKVKAKRSIRNLFSKRDGKRPENTAKPRQPSAGNLLSRHLNFTRSNVSSAAKKSTATDEGNARPKSRASLFNLRARRQAITTTVRSASTAVPHGMNATIAEALFATNAVDTPSTAAQIISSTTVPVPSATTVEALAATDENVARISHRIMARVETLPEDSPERVLGCEIVEALLNALEWSKQAEVARARAANAAREAAAAAHHAGVLAGRVRREIETLQSLLENGINSETRETVLELVQDMATYYRQQTTRLVENS